MKFIFATFTYLVFAALIAYGIVHTAQGKGVWVLVLAMLAFAFSMGRCCLPAKH